MALTTVMVGALLAILDITIVNLAIPRIISELKISVKTSSWISTAYIIANAAFVPIWGKIGDTIGRKKVYIYSFSAFIGASLLAALSWNFSSLIFFRVLQAVMISASLPTAMAIITVTFTEPKERAQALGIFSSGFAAGLILGPLIGGPLIDHLGWRSVFFLNLPVGLLGLFMAQTFLEESSSGKKIKNFDWLGSIIFGLSVTALIVLLENGVDWGWLSGKSIIYAFSSIIFFLFFYYIEANHPEPIMDFSFFKNEAFSTTIANNAISFMGLQGSIFLVPLFAQTFLGYSATQAGSIFIPMAIFMVVGAPIGASLTGKVKAKYVIAASTFIAAIGIGLLMLIDPKSTFIDLAAPLGIMAFGLGFGMAQRTSLVMGSVPKEQAGNASSILTLSRQIFGALGIGILSTVLQYSIENHVLSIAQASTINTANPNILQEIATLIILKAQIAGYSTVFFWATVFMVIGGVTALFIREK